MKSFASDNYAGAHPEVLAAIAEANEGHAVAYGADPWTARSEATLRSHFGSESTSLLVFNGSAANVLCLRIACRPWEAAICSAHAHVNVDEAGAPEAVAGIKLLAVPTSDGKLTPDDVLSQLHRVGDEHAVQPSLVSITESTELGTRYAPGEIAALAEVAHAHGLRLHVDGARLANAAAAEGVGLGDLTTRAGVDLLSLGGTKNGMLFGEAVVLLDSHLRNGAVNLRKQTLQLASKGRFLAAQFVAMYEGDLWRRSAAHANAMATRLAGRLGRIPAVRITQPTEANGVFAIVPAAATRAARTTWPFYTWEPTTGEVRLMCSWDTTPEDVDEFSEALAQACAGA
ncbi:MAG: threonine aldolase [Solirubrobacterales bacterium]|nr:threonine aldolase [Solirubrobacterales bacterium]